MAEPTLEERVTAVETQLAGLFRQAANGLPADTNGHPTGAGATPLPLDQRVTAVEVALQQLLVRMNSARPAPTPLPAWTEEDERWAAEYEPYRQYFRWTGREPPPDWRPGDPMPDPDW